ncbi:3-keto-disaccharide hydrolase [Chitinophaga agri]|uniref:DUF1080 domain-containing protein n=1 Tax=Chitinophaga agri TaxID=2703787 RepID=A0A6B9ZFB1_9BACT|nr:DUF1080 domain-containing protein [Chitinophaga agri]QHS59233.1 DUF1080 domain-containing protein [Chitinophaga agri]
MNRKHYLFALMSVVFTACAGTQADNTLSGKETADGWQLLFDGKTTHGWHLYNRGDKPSQWEVKDGALVCSPGPGKELGDLVTDSSYSNYDLTFDWKISVDGNSGVFVNVTERADIPTAWASGPEYQLLEQSHHDYVIENKRPGCLYGFSPQLNKATPKPAGEWNQSEIKQENGKVSFYLNGVLTAEQDFNTQQWKDAVANSGFKVFPEFGKQTSGKIALQDWNKGIAFKNIKLRKL